MVLKLTIVLFACTIDNEWLLVNDSWVTVAEQFYNFFL